jgi:hypothetical protein
VDYKITFTTTNLGPFEPIRMGPLDLINHLLNFLAPAFAVGTVLALVAAFSRKKVAVGGTVYRQAAINSIAGVLALLLGLVFFGRDGKMASYGAMVLACASSQWWAVRARH